MLPPAIDITETPTAATATYTVVLHGPQERKPIDRNHDCCEGIDRPIFWGSNRGCKRLVPPKITLAEHNGDDDAEHHKRPKDVMPHQFRRVQVTELPPINRKQSPQRMGSDRAEESKTQIHRRGSGSFCGRIQDDTRV